MDCVSLSVVIPAHNESAVLRDTLRTVLAQAPDEVIVVCDSCTDDTAAIARGAGVTVAEVATRNVAANRNLGARLSHGEMLLMLDADTVVGSGALAAIRAAGAAGADWGGLTLRPDLPHPLAGPRLAAMNQISRRWGWYYGNIYVRRDVLLAAGGYDESHGWGEDVAVCLRLARVARHTWLPEGYLVYSDRRFRENGYLRENATRLRRSLGAIWRHRHEGLRALAPLRAAQLAPASPAPRSPQQT
jgi:glycosyltransferase involved in cell wall biosynthesis